MDRIDQLVNALSALGDWPDGYCWCFTFAQAADGHTVECQEALKALQLVHPDAKVSKAMSSRYQEDPTLEPS